MAVFYSELKSLYLIIKITLTSDTLLAIQAKSFEYKCILVHRTRTKPEENLRLET